MFQVKIMEFGKDEPVEIMEAVTERMADKIDRGVNINLNHDKFYTLVEEKP